jgi:hypothetical protein
LLHILSCSFPLSLPVNTLSSCKPTCVGHLILTKTQRTS